jgi:colanic acid biosynthesis glycosyl transferase WcaI
LFKITIPSRTQAYFFIGKPVVMAVAGDASELVDVASAGVCCIPEDPDDLANSIKKLVALPRSELDLIGKNASTFYQQELSLSKGVSGFIQVFQKVVK